MKSVETKSMPWFDHMRSRVSSGGAKRNWVIYDNGINSYQMNFQGVLWGEDMLSWAKGRETLAIVDFMSSTGAIRSIFEKMPLDKPKFGLAVSLEDIRNNLRRKRDTELNIEKLNGDIMLPSTWRKIKQKLGGRKVDLIIERAEGGLEALPRDLQLCEFEFALSRMWEMLKENGMILLQTPNPSYWDIVRIDVEHWVKFLQESNIDIVFDRYGRVVKAVKTAGSPEKLPFLK